MNISNTIFYRREEYKLDFEKGEKDYRKIDKKELDKFLDEKIEKLEISKELQNITKDDIVVSYDFNSLNPSAQKDLNSTWPEIKRPYPFEKCMSDAVCSLFNSERWNELNRSAFLSVKHHNHENLIFHLPIRKNIVNPYKNKRFEEINRIRNDVIV